MILLIAVYYEKEDLPGIAFIFDVSPADAKIMIDGKEYDNVPGEKILTEKGEHTIMILPPNDSYEEPDAIKKWVTTDTGTVFIQKSLKIKNGTLTLEAGSDCMHGVQASIYRMNEETGYKGKGKNKTEIIKLVKEKYPTVSIIVPRYEYTMEPGNYKLVLQKIGYKTKKIDIAITPNYNTNRSIELKDMTVVSGTVGNTACNLFCPKGGNCCCCNGSGKCRICKGTGYRTCHCCEGKGTFWIDGEYKKCNTCNGSGQEICNICKGQQYCTACKGSGKN